MNYTINTLDYQHLGFLVLIPEDEREPLFGQGIIKLQSNDADILQSKEALKLTELTQMFSWHIDNDVMLLTRDETPLAEFKNEYLHVGDCYYLIQDLTGTV